MTMRITVVTVTLNAGRFLSQSLASVAAQGDACHEHIIVDGGSTDGTLRIIEDHAAMFSRTRWISEPDNGIAEAMNKGIALATGDVVAFLHADDYYPDPSVLRSVADTLARYPDRLWLTGGLRLVDERGEALREIGVRRYSFRRLERSNIILHPATFVSRRAFAMLGGFSSQWRLAMDYEFWLRLGAIEAPLRFAQIVANFRVHPGSSSCYGLKTAFAEEREIRLQHLRQRPAQRMLYSMLDAVKASLGSFQMRLYLRRRLGQ